MPQACRGHPHFHWYDTYDTFSPVETGDASGAPSGRRSGKERQWTVEAASWRS